MTKVGHFTTAIGVTVIQTSIFNGTISFADFNTKLMSNLTRPAVAYVSKFGNGQCEPLFFNLEI